MKNACILTRAGFALFCATLSLLSIGTNAPAAEKIVIGFSQTTMNSTWRVAMVDGNKKYVAEHYPDVELIVTDGQNQATKQVNDVGSLMARGIKVLIISPVQAQPLTPIVKQVMEANIPVVTLDREVNTKVTCQIGAQNRPIGVAAGEFIIEKLQGTGNVIEIEGTVGASATTDRHEGFRDALREAPRISVVKSGLVGSLRVDNSHTVNDNVRSGIELRGRMIGKPLSVIKAAIACGRSRTVVRGLAVHPTVGDGANNRHKVEVTGS